MAPRTHVYRSTPRLAWRRPDNRAIIVLLFGNPFRHLPQRHPSYRGAPSQLCRSSWISPAAPQNKVECKIPFAFLRFVNLFRSVHSGMRAVLVAKQDQDFPQHSTASQNSRFHRAHRHAKNFSHFHHVRHSFQIPQDHGASKNLRHMTRAWRTACCTSCEAAWSNGVPRSSSISERYVAARRFGVDRILLPVIPATASAGGSTPREWQFCKPGLQRTAAPKSANAAKGLQENVFVMSAASEDSTIIDTTRPYTGPE